MTGGSVLFCWALAVVLDEHQVPQLKVPLAITVNPAVVIGIIFLITVLRP
jgi:hypothetical protein